MVTTLEAIALRRQLTASRMKPLFLIVQRNAQFWLRSPFPASRGYVQFRGSQMLFEYYVGEGLQLQPLANFKKANALHGACVKPTAGVACNRAGLARLLDEMVATRVRRGRFTAYEYYFDFGGRPPWISGMATATGIQAFGRAGQLLNTTKWRRYATEAMGAFTTPAPTGVLTRGPLGGTHYLQYSMSPAPVHHQRAAAVGDRPVRLRRDHRRSPPPPGCGAPPSPRRATSWPPATPATGRPTPTAAASPRVSTTTSCSSSPRACATAPRSSSTAPPPGTSATTSPSRPRWPSPGPRP